MIPGKHNMELTDGWDTPKVAVPPSPPVIQAPQPELVDKQNNSNYEGQPAWPTPGQAQNQTPANVGQQQQQQQQQQPPHQQQNQNNHRGYSLNNQQNNNYHQGNSGRHYQNSSPDQQPRSYNSSHHYNDFQKPYHQHPHQMPTAPPQNHQQSAPIMRSAPPPQPAPVVPKPPMEAEESTLEQLRVKNQYNPSELDLSLVDNAR
jgi:hypothetical protein